MRRPAAIVLLALLSACTGGLGGEATPPAICSTLTGLPYPERAPAIDAEGERDAVLEEMRESCPEVVDTLEGIERIVDASSRLDDVSVLAAGAEVTCREAGITLSLVSPFDDRVRVAITGWFLDGTGSVVAADAAVSDVVAPREPAEVHVPVAAPPGAVDCGVEAQPFLVTDRVATDTWDASLGLAPPLPDTASDDWPAVLAALVAAELGVESEGDWTKAGAFEDVRSKNYQRLVSSRGAADPPDYRIVAVCRTRTVTDGTALVVYEFSTPDLERALAAGVFTRSPHDGRWRWLNTAMVLDASDGCGLLGGVEIV